MSEDQLTLYYHPGSFYSHKALLYLVEKDVRFKHRTVNLQGGETYQPHFMKLNPEGKIPILKDGDQVIADSNDIIRHVEDKFTTHCTLLPSDADIRKQCLSLWELLDSIAIERMSFGSLTYPQYATSPKIPRFLGNIRKNTLKSKAPIKMMEALKVKHPELREVYEAKIEKMHKMVDGMFSEENLIREIEKTETCLSAMEDQLRRTQTQFPDREHWLLSADFTVADVVLAVTLNRLDFAGFSDRFWGPGSSRPLLAKYFRQLSTRKSFQDVCVNSASFWKFGLPFLMSVVPWKSLFTVAVIAAVVGVSVKYLLDKRT